MDNQSRRCVITGLGVVTPIGIGKEAFWDSLVNGRTNFSQITRFQLEDFDKTRIAGQIDTFNPADYVAQDTIRKIGNIGARSNAGLMLYYGVAAAKLAAKDANLNLSELDRERIGVMAGGASGDASLMKGSNIHFGNIPYHLANALPGLIGRELDLHGVTSSISAACATGNLALRAGCLEIMTGNVDMMFIGASEAPIDVPYIFGTEQNRKRGIVAFSKRNDIERGMSPFSQERDGVVVSEGAGVLVLEELNCALRRRANIYAEVLGTGEYTDYAPHPAAAVENGYRRAIEKAIKNSGINHLDSHLIYVNAHGTATDLNDPSESYAVLKNFGEKVPISSFKSIMGHPQSPSSTIELIGSALVLKNGIIPPTNLRTVAEDCAKLDYVREARSLPVDIVVKNAAGFNYTYSSVVLGRYAD